MWVAGALILAGLALASWYWWRRQLSLPVAGLLVFLLGVMLPAPPLPAGDIARVTAVRGWFDGEIIYRNGSAFYGAEVSEWRFGNGPFTAPAKSFKVWVEQSQAETEYGSRFEAWGRIYQGNPAYDEGYIYPKELRPLAGRSGGIIRRGLIGLRTAICDLYRRYPGGSEGELLAGLVFGESSGLSGETQGWLRDAGSLHLLSISGLHVGFIALLVFGLAGLIGWRGWRALALLIPVSLAYLVLCGFKPPLLRATVVTLATGAGVAWRRRINAENLLGLAAMAVLCIQPQALRTVSFQLSFAACAGLIFLYPRWAQWCPAGPAWALRPLLISLSATLATLPILASAFGRVSLIAPLANLFIVPLAGLAMQAGLLFGLLGAVVSWAAAPFLCGVGLILRLILWLARFFAGLPFAAINVGAWPWLAVLVFYLVLAGVSIGMERNLLNRRPRLPWGVILLVLSAILAALIWWQVLAVPKDLTLAVIDVGQGDSIFVRAPEGQTMLIDGGETEEGARVLSYLRKAGVNRLDLVVLSHPHSDHVGGLCAVIAEMPVGRVLDPGWQQTTEVYQQFLQEIKEKGIPWQRARRGLSFTLGRVKGTVLYPYPGAAQPDDLNDGSLVIRLIYGKQAFLLTGDLGQSGEEELLSSGDDLRADVLKVAHHGSSTSTGEGWLAAIQPQLAVISVGQGNQFHHPSAATLARLNHAGAEVYRTDENGTILIEADGKRYSCRTER